TVLVKEAVGFGFDKGRSLACTHIVDGGLLGQIYRQWIHPVYSPGSDFECRCTGCQSGMTGDISNMGGYRVEVVLYKKADREIPGGCQIERFQGGSNVGGSVAEISDGRVHVENVFRSGCHLSVVSLCPGISGGQRHASTNDGVGA